MDDMISRQAAIDALENDKAALDKIIKGMSAEDMLLKYYVAQHNQVSYDIDAIVQLPPANCSEFPNNSDTISRQAAIDALHMHLMYRMGTDSNKKRLDEWINNLPSAQPEIIRCKDCKHWKDSDGVFRRGIGVESKCPLNLNQVYEGTFYCGLGERREVTT